MTNALHFLRGYFLIVPLNVPVNFLSDYILQTAKILQETNTVLLVDYSCPVSLFSLLTSKKERAKVIAGMRFIRNASSVGKGVFRPVGILPFQRLGLIRKLNVIMGIGQLSLLVMLSKKRNVGIWGFHPHMADFIGKFHEKFSLYDCVDAYGEEQENGEAYRMLEQRLFHYATHIVCNSHALCDYKQKKYPIRKKRIYVVPCGCDVSLFEKKKNVFRSLSHPRIGYIGYINYRVDFDLLEYLLSHFPKWSFILVGPIFSHMQEDKEASIAVRLSRLRMYRNFSFEGEKEKHEVARYVNSFDIGMIPYRVQFASVRYCNPMKAYEYLAAGKPVVATNIPALRELRYPWIKTTRTFVSFANSLESVWNDHGDIPTRALRGIADAHSWRNKVHAIENILARGQER